MAIANIILGILMILCAVFILTMPTLSGVAICSFLSAVMLVTGVVSIFRFIKAKNAEKAAQKEGQPYLKTGIGSLVFGIAAVILAILSYSSADGASAFMKVVTVVFGAWILLDGFSFVKRGIEMKKIAAPGWVPVIIMGVFIALAGICCIANTFAGLTAVSTMYGISLMMFGFALLIV